MDRQSNHSQELDSQEQLAQEYASRHQDYDGVRRSSKRSRGPGFGMGMLAGMSLMFLIVLLTMAGSQFLLNQDKKAAKEQSASEKETTKEVITEKGVEQKAGELADLIDQYYYEDIDKKSLVEYYRYLLWNRHSADTEHGNKNCHHTPCVSGNSCGGSWHQRWGCNCKGGGY